MTDRITRPNRAAPTIAPADKNVSPAAIAEVQNSVQPLLDAYNQRFGADAGDAARITPTDNGFRITGGPFLSIGDIQKAIRTANPRGNTGIVSRSDGSHFYVRVVPRTNAHVNHPPVEGTTDAWRNIIRGPYRGPGDGPRLITADAAPFTIGSAIEPPKG